MSKNILFFVFLNLTIELGESLPRANHFKNLHQFEGLICKKDICLFEIETESRIACSILCKSNDGCLGFFFNHNTTKCAGSNIALQDIAQGPVVNEDGASYFYEVFNEILPPSASSQTSGQTTALTTTTSTDQRQKTQMTSTTTQQITQVTTAGPMLDQLWASWNSSAYKILCCGTFSQLVTMCDALALSHLAWIESYDENNYVGDLMEKSGTHHSYIGVVYDREKSVLRYYPNMSLFEVEGEWLEKGTPVDEHECVKTDSRGRWSVVDCSMNLTAICEMPFSKANIME